MKVAQLCSILCDPLDCTVHGIFQARILEWVAVPFSKGSSQSSDQIQISLTVSRFFTNLSYQGSPRILEWVAYSFSRGSSWPRNRTRVSCIVGGFFYQLIYKTQSLRTGKMSGSFICCNRFSFCFPHTYVYLLKRSIDSNNFWISNPVSMSLGFTTSRSWWILDI